MWMAPADLNLRNRNTRVAIRPRVEGSPGMSGNEEVVREMREISGKNRTSIKMSGKNEALWRKKNNPCFFKTGNGNNGR